MNVPFSSAARSGEPIEHRFPALLRAVVDDLELDTASHLDGT